MAKCYGCVLGKDTEPCLAETCTNSLLPMEPLRKSLKNQNIAGQGGRIENNCDDLCSPCLRVDGVPYQWT